MRPALRIQILGALAVPRALEASALTPRRLGPVPGLNTVSRTPTQGGV